MEKLRKELREAKSSGISSWIDEVSRKIERFESLKELKEEFKNCNKETIFEISVTDNRERTSDYIVFEISIQDNKLVAQHVGLTKEEEESDKIAFKSVELDECFTLDEHLQELHQECTEAIINSELFELND